MKKYFYKRLVLSLALLSILTCHAQNISGYWQGYIHITSKDSLAVGIFLSQSGDSLMAEFDSPDQYAIGIEATNVTWTDSTLALKSKTINASFSGKLSADGKYIAGTFKQGRSKLPLVLSNNFERIVINRPQTPKAPYPYAEEEIRIMDKSGKFSLLNGTLTIPSGQSKGLVILITGSGWQDRDESIFGHKPFLVIADYLTRQGYTVFRYDDFPQAIFIKSTTYDFADGVTMILDSFAKRNDLSTLPTGLLGHSEGSLIAEIVAARDKRIDFIISIGGVAQKTSDVLIYQVRAINEVDGLLTASEIDKTTELSSQLYKIVEKAKTPEEAAKRASKFWDAQTKLLTPEQQKLYNFTIDNKRTILSQLTTEWYFTFFHLDPSKFLKKVKCPVLTLGGEKDLQVDAKTNNALFKKLLPPNEHHKFLTIPQANHLLQTCTTGGVSEYGIIEETIQPQALEIMLDWLNSLK